MKIKVHKVMLGRVGTNCYFVINQETKEVLIFDPADRADVIVGIIEKDELQPRAILLTHGHFDHIMAVNILAEKYKIPVYAHEDEAELLKDSNINASAMVGTAVSVLPTNLLKDGEKLTIAGIAMKVLYTPGHTKGGVCYYIPEAKKVISGDTLFADSIGRTDLPTGNYSTLLQSIRTKLFALEDSTEVLPGHGEATTIGHEKKYNPFVN